MYFRPLQNGLPVVMRNSVKDEFLAAINHELRTPLTNILGWTLLLRSGKLDHAASNRALETIERNARKQIQQIEDLLDVSRFTRGELRIHMQLIELRPVISDATWAISTAAHAKGIAIEMNIDPEVGPVLGERGRLQQVVWNLLSNAVKFTPNGGRVGISLVRAWPHAQIVVKDTGRGIASEFLPHIFERFRQADSVTTRNYGGLGLGLAVARELVELHGGTIHAASSGEGQGAVFTVELPIADADAQRTHPLIAAC
jgi:signal transduction histidine kinase